MAFDGLMTQTVAQELKSSLTAGRINKIYQLSNHEILMAIRAGGKNRKVLFSTHPSYARIQLTDLSYQYPDEPPMFCMFLRKHLEGGIIYNVEQVNDDRIIKFTIRHLNELGDSMIKFLYLEIMGKHSNLILTDTSHRILETIKHISPLLNRVRSLQPGAEYVLPPKPQKDNPYEVTQERFMELVQFGENYQKQLVANFHGLSPLIAKEIIHQSVSDQVEDLYHSFLTVLSEIKDQANPTVMIGAKENFYLIPLRHLDARQESTDLWGMFDRFYFGKDERDRIKQHFADIDRFIRSEYDKNVKKRQKLYDDLEKSEKADDFKIKGELLLANLHQIQRGASAVRLQNYYEPDLAEIQIELNPSWGASDNAQKYFQKYQKAKASVSHIMEQLEITEQEIAYFETLLTQVGTANIKDVYEIKEELELGGYLRRRQSKKRKANQKPNIEKYLSTDGVEIFLGKNNLQNDYLTHKFGRRNEWWFHAKDMPGSHVLVRSEAADLTEDTIRSAAQLASYFSKGRDSSSVPVDYTRVRNVKKIPAAHLGFVTYENQKTIYIDPDETFIMGLKKG
ncbi:MAG: NFACT family protein [Turicibacter sp.]|nr:NFACT family protein [Turicibacter sp.]